MVITYYSLNYSLKVTILSGDQGSVLDRIMQLSGCWGCQRSSKIKNTTMLYML